MVQDLQMFPPSVLSVHLSSLCVFDEPRLQHPREFRLQQRLPQPKPHQRLPQANAELQLRLRLLQHRRRSKMMIV